MPAPPKNLALQQRIEALQRLYSRFSADPKAKICLWLLEADEYPMIEKFFKLETSVAATSADLFLKFESPFEHPDTYAESLVAELAVNVATYQADTKQNRVAINWKAPASNPEARRSGTFFLSNLSAFAKGIEDFDDKLLAYLAPPSVAAFEKMEDWLIGLMEAPWPENARLMLVDFVDNRVFKRLGRQFPGAVAEIRPQLDMPQAMKETAMAAGGNHPGAVFQTHFIDLTAAAAKGDMPKVDVAANKAMSIAMEQNWRHLQIAVFTVVGSAWLNKKDYDKAFAEFDAAEKTARRGVEEEDPGAGRLLANTLFSKGAIWVTQGAFDRASTLYEGIVPIIEKEKDLYLTMEAWRMAGYCYERSSAAKDALRCYTGALETGEKIEDAYRKNSTLPYVGAALIKLLEKEGDYRRAEATEGTMQALLGKDWKTQAPLKT